MNNNPLKTLNIEKVSYQDICKQLDDEKKRLEAVYNNITTTFNQNIQRISVGGHVSTSTPSNERFVERVFYRLFTDHENIESALSQLNSTNSSMNTYFLNFSLYLFNSIKEYETVIENFKSNPNSRVEKDSLMDLYIKKMYEAKVAEITKTVVGDTQVTDVETFGSTFESQILNNQDYKDATNAYRLIATAKARSNLSPELFIKYKLGSKSNIINTTPEIKNAAASLIRQDREYAEEHKDIIYAYPNVSQGERIANKIPENQQHNIGWGVELCEFNEVMDKDVDTPDFKGNVSVTHLGTFFAQSEYKNCKISNKRVRPIIKSSKDKRMSSETPFPVEEYDVYRFMPRNKREYYFYKIKKTDKEGKISNHLVVSSVNPSMFYDKEKRDYLAAVYLSDYMLGIASENGGFAGKVIGEGANDFSISNNDAFAYAACMLFQAGTMGEMYGENGMITDMTIEDIKKRIPGMSDKAREVLEYGAK